MPSNVGPWICDVCHRAINKEDLAYVIWEDDGKGTLSQFKIIHQSVCNNTNQDFAPLEEFLGANGLARLTVLLSIGQIGKNLGQSSICQIKDFDGFVDFFRRIQLPFYEQARVKFNNPELLEELADQNEFAPYLPSALEKLSKKY